MIAFVDLVLAAVEEHHQLAVATGNVAHFAGAAVRVENPWLPSPVIVVI